MYILHKHLQTCDKCFRLLCDNTFSLINCNLIIKFEQMDQVTDVEEAGQLVLVISDHLKTLLLL